MCVGSLIAEAPSVVGGRWSVVGGRWSVVSVLILCIGKLSPAIAMQFSEVIASSSHEKIATT